MWNYDDDDDNENWYNEHFTTILQVIYSHTMNTLNQSYSRYNVLQRPKALMYLLLNELRNEH